MPGTEKPLRKSVTLLPNVARRVRSLARAGRTSATRVIVELIQSGLEVRKQARVQFLGVADRLTRSQDPEEQAWLKADLARLTFGDE